MTTKELADLLRTTPAAVLQMRYRGLAPQGTRIGRRVLYDREVVDAWLAAKTAADPIAQRAISQPGQR